MKKVILVLFIAAAFMKTTGSFAQVNVQDSLALVDLYDSCGGAGWNGPWTLAKPVSTWGGVTTVAGRVTEINLYVRQLSGIIPSSLGNLSALTYLNLGSNYGISGEIPSSLGNLSNLTWLEIDNNLLTGNIPSSLGNLSQVTYIYLSYNQLSGGIPSSLGSLSNLTTLILESNLLNDSIPSSLGNLSNLTGLFLDENQLTGNIPSSLGNLTNLVNLALNQNQLSGNIPSSLSGLSKLQNLDISFNNFSDSIPSSLNNFSNLNYLALGANDFTFSGMEGIATAYSFAQYTPQANIPLHYNAGQLSVSTGGTLSNNTYNWYKDNVLYQTNVGDSILTVTENGNYYVYITNAIATQLGLTSNTLPVLSPSTQDSLALVDLYNSTGGANWTNHTNWLTSAPISSWYGIQTNATRVTYIDEVQNNLIGTLPSSLGNLTDLIALQLNQNNISGSIPNSLGNLLQLTELSLDNNNLTGPIPASLGNLSNLTVLSMLFNKVNGSIPLSLGNLANLTYLGLYSDSLSDTIPSILGNLTKLNFLYLGANNLTGTIPSSLGNLLNLEGLDLSYNYLTGSMPSSLGNITNLSQVYLDDNQLNGAIPSSFDNFPNLGYLDLHDNQFTFAGMEGIVAAYENENNTVVVYAPQATIPLNYNAGQLSVSAGGTLANDTFHWYKDNVLYQINVGDSVLAITENGSYSVAVTNAIATQLTLFSDTVAVGTLAVKLLGFTATKESSKNVLQWTTGQEVNSSYFEVERSGDGASFSAIGQMDAAGNSSVAKNYSLVDSKPVNGMNYYRLKMVDRDGEFSYSIIRTINEVVSFGVGIYPNPVQSTLNLNFTSDKAMTLQVEVVDNEGKVVASQQVEVAAGSSIQSINVGSLSSGEYYVRLVGEDEEMEERFVK